MCRHLNSKLSSFGLVLLFFFGALTNRRETLIEWKNECAHTQNLIWSTKSEILVVTEPEVIVLFISSESISSGKMSLVCWFTII